MYPAARRQELATFLRSRRQRVDPRELGVDTARRRRPGLRREEVAAMAGVSISWYTWLEQARDIHPSPEVIRSIARVLRLNTAEVEYVLNLAGHVPRPIGPLDGHDPFADTQLRELMVGFMPNPASVLMPSFDYVAWNRASEWLVPGFLGDQDRRPHNVLRFLFSGDQDPDLVGDPQGPASLVSQLRVNAAMHPNDDTLTELVDELHDTSPEFARIWQRHDVAASAPPSQVQFLHPDAETLTFCPVSLRPQLYPHLTMLVFLPADEATSRVLDRCLVREPGSNELPAQPPAACSS